MTLQVAMTGDAGAFLAASSVMLILVEGLKAIAKTCKCPVHITRKLVHMSAGPVFLLTWPWFSSGRSGRTWAALVPATMTAKFALTGLGVLRFDGDVRLMSRTGDRTELLRGPLLYGLVFTAATILGFRTTTAAGALMALCAGDGMAELVGRSFGGRHRLPWSPRKSWAGSAAYVASAFSAALLFVDLFHRWGWVSGESMAELLLPLLAASVASAAAESLPMSDIDNVVAPVVFAAVMWAAAPRRAQH